MASIDVGLARTMMPPQRSHVPAEHAQPVDAEPASSTAAMRRTALHQRGALQDLAMNDDLSGLVASMRRNRARGSDETNQAPQAWVDHVLDPKGPEKLAALRLQLDALPSLDVATLRSLLAALFPDASDAVAVLRTLRSGMELEEAAQVLDDLEHELLGGTPAQRQAVRAGLNVALKARLHARPLAATPAQLRQSYRQFLGSGEPLDSYEEWIALYGFERRGRVVDFIEHAMTADMQALDPSCSLIEFGQLLQRVRQLTTIRSADHLLLDCCWDASMMKRIGVDQPALLRALFAMVRDGGGLQRLFDTVFVQVAYALHAEDKVRFAQNMRRFLKAVPHALWQTVEQHVQALQELDTLLWAALAQERRQHGDGNWTSV